MKLLLGILEICAVIVGGLIGVALILAAALVTCAAGVVCGLMLLLAFFNWLGWKATHHMASWDSFVWACEYAGVCALIVFVVRGLPLLVRSDRIPARFHGPPPRF